MQEQYQQYISGNELLTFDAVSTRTISLLTTVTNTRKLIGVNRKNNAGGD